MYKCNFLLGFSFVGEFGKVGKTKIKREKRNENVMHAVEQSLGI